jgi:hypothetical protein
MSELVFVMRFFGRNCDLGRLSAIIQASRAVSNSRHSAITSKNGQFAPVSSVMLTAYQSRSIEAAEAVTVTALAIAAFEFEGRQHGPLGSPC